MDLADALPLGELAAAFAALPVFPLFDTAYFIISVLYLKYEPGECGPWPGEGRGELRCRCAGTDPELPGTNRFCHLPVPLLCLLSPARGQLRCRCAGTDPALPRTNRFCPSPSPAACHRRCHSSDTCA